MPEKCRYYLEHPEERKKFSEEAYQNFVKDFKYSQFIPIDFINTIH